MKTSRQRRITRRQFVGGALAAAGVITGAPALLRGRNLNNKLNLAFIACGGRANTNISELTITAGRNGAQGAGAARGRGGTGAPAAPHPDENVVVLCDVNQIALDSASQRFPQAKTFNDLRRVFDNPNDFDANLLQLPVTAELRPLRAEEGSGIPKLQRQPVTVETVLDHRADHPSRALRAQRD